MGCNNCRDFNKNSCTDITTTNCISSQADSVTELEICLDDSLTYVLNIILTKIKNLLKGRGIILEDIDFSDCEYLEDMLGVQEKNLINVLKIYKQAICELKEAQTITEEQLTSFTNVSLYTLGCLPPLDPCDEPYDFKTLIQAIITKICAINTQLSTIAASLLDIVEEGAGNFMLGAIKSAGNNGISYSGSGASAVVTFQALVPPYCPILYTGSLAYFNGSGIGLVNTPYQGWYVCNGSNGTPNSSTLPQNLAGTLKYIMRLT